MGEYRISELAERSGFPASTLRFYEHAGLLVAARLPAGYRLYDDAALERLRFIAAGKGLSLPLEEIRELLAVWEGGVCADVRTRLLPLVAARIADAQRRVAELSAFVAALACVHEDLGDPAPDGPCGARCGCVSADQSEPVLVGRALRLLPDPEAVPVACTVGGDEQVVRRGEWARLLDFVRNRRRMDHGLRMTFPPNGELAGQVAELVAAEQSCCAFLDFTLRFTPAALVLTVDAPPGAGAALTELFGVTA